jgi:hypothetical protein
MANDTKPSDERNGCFLDKQWCCKVCDGEIPDGHTDRCDIWKLEKKHKDFIAAEYNAVLLERDELQKANREWALSDAKTRSGWFIQRVAELEGGLRAIGGWALAAGNMETFRKVKSLLPNDFTDSKGGQHG